jgi:hypothetical protein
MTGMGTFLATVLLAVPLIVWLRGTILFDGPQLKLARVSNAPRGKFLTSQKSHSSLTAARLDSDLAAQRWMR